MRKRVAVVSMLMLLLVAVFPMGCVAEAVSAPSAQILDETPLMFEEGSHPWAITYRSYFLTKTAQVDNLIFSVEESVYQPDQAANLMARIIEDMQVISATIPVMSKPHTLYVVKATLNGVVQQVGDAIYCTVDDIMSGSYRSSLIASMSEISAYWKTIGLSGYLFDRPIHDAMLRAYYEKADDLDILSLFPAYFLAEFTGEEDMLIARETAFALADYVIREHGMRAFLVDDRVADRQEWLDSLGVHRDYSDPYADTLADYRYDFWKDGFPLAATTDRGDKIYMLFNEGDLENPRQVRAFLYEANVGLQAILDGIEREAPEYMQAVLAKLRSPITVRFGAKLGKNKAFVEERRIELLCCRAYLHEMAHILTQPPHNTRIVYDTDYWKYEAISEYLSISFYQTPNLRKSDY